MKFHDNYNILQNYNELQLCRIRTKEKGFWPDFTPTVDFRWIYHLLGIESYGEDDIWEGDDMYLNRFLILWMIY